MEASNTSDMYSNVSPIAALGVPTTNISELQLQVWHIQTYITLSLLPFIIVLDTLLITSITVFNIFHTPHYTLILGQVVSDLIFGIVSSLMNYLYHFDETNIIQNNTVCTAAWVTYIILEHAGLYFYVFITIDRYVAIRYPFWYEEHESLRGTVKLVGVVFLLSFLAGGSFILCHIEDSKCSYYKVIPKEYFIIMFVEYNSIPIVPLILNIIIYKTAIKNKGPGSKKSSHLWSSVKLAIYLYGIFIITWMPKNICIPMKYVFPDHQINVYLTAIFYTLYCAYPLLNAAVIVLVKRNFGKSFYLLLTTPPWAWRDQRNYFDDTLSRYSRRTNDTTSGYSGKTNERTSGYSGKTTQPRFNSPSRIYIDEASDPTSTI